MRVKVTMFVDVPDYQWKRTFIYRRKDTNSKAEHRGQTFLITNEIRRALGSTHPFWLTSLNNFDLTWETTKVPSKDHQCTCEGGPPGPCLYPKECFPENNKKKELNNEMPKLR